MKYLEFTFTVTPKCEATEDVLSAVLAEIGFDSFVHTDELDRPCVAQVENFPEAPVFADKAEEDQYKAYIQTDLFDKDALTEALAAYPIPDTQIRYEYTEAEDKDWNEEWEKNYFRPLIVGDEAAPRCVIASTFHKDVPSGKYNIVIDPRMSFGTGHHATTSQMIGRILDDDMTGKTVLDMGCGTSILAILARMRGARRVVAIDVDEWCVRNSEDNIGLNHVDGIEVRLGNAETLAEYPATFDLVIANINRNILLADLQHYATAMHHGSEIYMSGFYRDDVPMLRTEAERHGLTLIDERSLDNWACLKFRM